MELEKRKVVTLTGQSLNGSVSIEGSVDNKEPKEIRIADIPKKILYDVSGFERVETIEVLDDTHVEFGFLIHAKHCCNNENWNYVVPQFIKSCCWLKEHYESLELIYMHYRKSDRVVLRFSVIFEGVSLDTVIALASDLLVKFNSSFNK